MVQTNKDPTYKRGLLRKTNRLGNETIQLILEAAKEVLVTQGAEKFTIDRVAKEANITKGTLIYHFQSKEQLLLALMDNYVAHLQREFEEGKKRALLNPKYPKDIDLNVAGFIEWYRKYRKENQAYSAFGLTLLSIAIGNPEVQEKILGWYRDLFASLRISKCPRALEMVLMLEGLFYLRHFQLDVTTDKEIDKLLESLEMSLCFRKSIEQGIESNSP